jgi:hypothetical protein
VEITAGGRVRCNKTLDVVIFKVESVFVSQKFMKEIKLVF